MSEKIEEFCSILCEQLNSVGRQLNTAKENIEALRQKREVAIQTQIEELTLEFEAGKDDVETTRENLKIYLEKKKAEAQAKLKQWKTKRELHKLEKQAKNTEQHIGHALAVAMTTLEQAEVEVIMLEAEATKIGHDDIQLASM